MTFLKHINLFLLISILCKTRYMKLCTMDEKIGVLFFNTLVVSDKSLQALCSESSGTSFSI